MSDARRGIPLLSEPPPTLIPPDSEIACRKCSKEFNLFFARSRRCNHCGYSYCHACSDFQALMPRSGSDMGGYQSMNVCGFCIEFLTITASGRNALKSMPLGKLKKYVSAYGIGIERAVEKDDIIDAIVAARGPNGCLPPANENYYRKYSVPNKATGRGRGLFSRPEQSSSSEPPRIPPRPPSNPTYEFPRPDLQPDVQFQPPPGPPPPRPQQPRDLPPRQSPDPSYAYTLPPHYQSSHHEPPPRMPDPGASRGHSGSGGYQRGYHQGYGGHVPPTPSYMTRPREQPPPQSNHHSQSSPPREAPSSSIPPRPPGEAPSSSVPPRHSGEAPSSSIPPRPTREAPSSSIPPRPTREAPFSPIPPRRPRPTSVPPLPNLDQLLEMSADSIASLSIGALKSILFANHVTTGLILEKGDLVKKVLVLVDNEKVERVRQRQMEEREEMERLQRAMETMHGTDHFERSTEEQTEGRQTGDRDHQDDESGLDYDIPMHRSDGESTENEGHHETNHSHSSSTPAASPPHPKPTGSIFERPGMCVICQDEDANIAIIDCGHMAMCRGCSDLVMTSSKECPLCRTRIVTEARLLRIYRT